jgi:putative pyridoxal-dependent aspartate 1-decarboxylase
MSNRVLKLFGKDRAASLECEKSLKRINELIEQLGKDAKRGHVVSGSLGLDSHHEEASLGFLAPAPPLDGVALEELFSLIETQIVVPSVQVQNSRFLGHMTGKLPVVAPALEYIIGCLNQNLVKTETASVATVVERQVIGWLHKLMFQKVDQFYQNQQHNPKVSLGNITSGGTVGNLTALAVAREKKLPEAAEKGMLEALRSNKYENAVILASRRVHYSIRKSAMVLGIGSANIIEIPVCNYTNKIDCKALTAELKRLEKANTCVVALVGIAGATETGSIDPLNQLANIAEEYETWFHVDAAWGGCLRFSKKNASKLQGIECADSIVIDGHKGLYVSLSCGAVIFKDITSLNSIRQHAQYIIREDSEDLGRTGIEGSRRFDALKLWSTWKLLGSTGYALLADEMVEKALVLQRLLIATGQFEITSEPEAGILTYRYNPPTLLGVERLNQINIELHRRLPKEKSFFVSRTVLESVVAFESVVVLRAVLLNPLINNEILEELVQAQLEITSTI